MQRKYHPTEKGLFCPQRSQWKQIVLFRDDERKLFLNLWLCFNFTKKKTLKLFFTRWWMVSVFIFEKWKMFFNNEFPFVFIHSQIFPLTLNTEVWSFLTSRVHGTNNKRTTAGGRRRPLEVDDDVVSSRLFVLLCVWWHVTLTDDWCRHLMNHVPLMVT